MLGLHGSSITVTEGNYKTIHPAILTSLSVHESGPRIIGIWSICESLSTEEIVVSINSMTTVIDGVVYCGHAATVEDMDLYRQEFPDDFENGQQNLAFGEIIDASIPACSVDEPGDFHLNLISNHTEVWAQSGYSVVVVFKKAA